MDKDIKKIFGENVKIYRELKGFSQEKLAEKIGIGVPALSNIECGKSYPLEATDAYNDMLKKLEKLKGNKSLFKRAYDFVVQLTQNL